MITVFEAIEDNVEWLKGTLSVIIQVHPPSA